MKGKRNHVPNMGKQTGYQTNSISNLEEIKEMEKQWRREREEDIEIEVNIDRSNGEG